MYNYPLQFQKIILVVVSFRKLAHVTVQLFKKHFSNHLIAGNAFTLDHYIQLSAQC